MSLPQEKVTVPLVRAMKAQGRRIAMVTAYDYPTGRLVDEAGADIALVGDSLAMVVLGHETTLPVTVEEMLHHTRAVRRGVKRALLVADMPFGSYQGSVPEAVANAARFLKEAGADAVKVEGGRRVVEAVRQMVEHGIPVRHIDADGSVVDHEAVMRRLTGGQQCLFGMVLTSRKRYRVRESRLE